MTADELPAASSFISSRWTRDNLVTGHPARLYSGRIIERIEAESLEALIEELQETRGPIRPGGGRMGVFTWDIACTGADGPFILQVPLVLDERGPRDRAKCDVPRRNVENMRHFIAQGLTRFVLEPRELVTLAGDVPAALFTALPEHRPLTFGHGALHVELAEGERSWLISLGAPATAELLAEMIAALVYHYDADADGGTAIADVYVNDGDFVARRRPDGAFDVRLTAARRLEGGIGPSLLLLLLVQMMAYEDWTVNGNLVGLPTPLANPSVVFEAVVRGRRYRSRDLGRPDEEGEREALRWIGTFGRSSEGRAYRPWAERFVAGRLPLSFGDDLRERWWQLMPVRMKLGVLELRGRQADGADAAASARVLRTFIDRLLAETGRAPDEDPRLRINDLGRDALLALLAEVDTAPASRAGVADELLARWPYRGLDHLVASVPGARGLRRVKSRLSFGRVVADDQQGTLESLGPLPADRPPRAVANPELYAPLALDPSVEAAAARAFPSFQGYMDATLHDPAWGYYGHAVTIGRGGHFNTNPEDLSPHYGKWLAAWAFRAWREMVGRGELAETDTFPVVEFGAGNGRLARDILDAVAQMGGTFASRMQYRIYETSASLREKQSALLGPDAVVAAGDARHPAETLAREFPGGLKGLVLTNEVPDAFGVHKVLLGADGRARAALVVPRVEPLLYEALRETTDGGLVRRITASDGALRESFGLRGNPGDLYLDGETWGAVMTALAALPAARRQALLGALWFEEAYVEASALPALAAHLAANAAQYATALAAEPSGVVVYVNVHAGRFIRELGASLAAGFVVTIDYGDTTWGLVQGARRGDFPFRVYGDWRDYVPRPNDPYTAPGTQDLTADVNFTDLARAGEEAGLKVVHYGPERDVTGDELPSLLEQAAEQEPKAEFLGNPVFKVLVLGTRASDAFAGPLATPLPLRCREQDVPKGRRSIIASIEKALGPG